MNFFNSYLNLSGGGIEPPHKDFQSNALPIELSKLILKFKLKCIDNYLLLI